MTSINTPPPHYTGYGRKLLSGEIVPVIRGRPVRDEPSTRRVVSRLPRVARLTGLRCLVSDGTSWESRGVESRSPEAAWSITMWPSTFPQCNPCGAFVDTLTCESAQTKHQYFLGIAE